MQKNTLKRRDLIKVNMTQVFKSRNLKGHQYFISVFPIRYIMTFIFLLSFVTLRGID